MSILLTLLISSFFNPLPQTPGQLPAVDTYFDGARFLPEIPTPDAYLGYHVGDWHVRHDALVGYLKTLDAASDRVSSEIIGWTHEARPLIQLAITSPANQARLEELRLAHLDLAKGNGDPTNQPVVIWMGYSIHGNEPSGANASMLVAYYLAAAENMADLLEKTIIILDPSLNPDGLDRFATWVNSNKGKNLVADGQTREHREPWPQGRTNHYFFDLNRDWLLLTQPESQARVKRFQEWRPNVLTDHHEMGTDGSFFFQPGVTSRNNPLTPDENVALTQLIASYHAKALDSQGKFYFTEQSFDDFYYGKGSTYPDIQGAVGILFEQASSRGHLQENSYGPLPFSATIKNQVTTSFSTLRACNENRVQLLTWQRDSVIESRKLAAADPIKAYVFGEPGDGVRAAKMAQVLRAHQITVDALAKPLVIQGKTLTSGYVVPTQQDQYRLVKTLFDKVTEFQDTTFYDVSSWHFPSAFGVLYEAIKEKPEDLMGEELETVSGPKGTFEESPTAMAYAFSWAPYTAPRAAYKLLNEGFKLRFTTVPFEAMSKEQAQTFAEGTVIVTLTPKERQDAAWLAKLRKIALDNQVQVMPIDSGLTPNGADLGSPSIMELKQPKVALLCGEGTDPSSVGPIWHLLDAQFGMEVTLIDLANFSGASLSPYTHLVLPDSKLERIVGVDIAKIASWLQEGGNLIAVGGAAKWAIDKKLATATIRTAEAPKEETKPERFPFGERDARNALESIAGACFEADLDLTNPMAFGLSQPKATFFKTDTLFFELAKNPYETPAVYTETPLVGGYVSEKNLALLKGSAAMIAQSVREGTVIILPDQPSFRGFWIGTNKLFLNALFFNNALSP